MGSDRPPTDSSQALDWHLADLERQAAAGRRLALFLRENGVAVAAVVATRVTFEAPGEPPTTVEDGWPELATLIDAVLGDNGAPADPPPYALSEADRTIVHRVHGRVTPENQARLVTIQHKLLHQARRDLEDSRAQTRALERAVAMRTLGLELLGEKP